MMKSYKIIRFFHESRARRTIRTGLTLEQARAYCNDPETSSSTCTNHVGHARTRKSGSWFDGYTEEK
jgi:hypothetical protein